MEPHPQLNSHHSQDKVCEPEEYDLEDVLDSFELSSNSLESLPIAKSESNYKQPNNKLEKYELYLKSELPLRRFEARARRLGKGRPRFYRYAKTGDEARSTYECGAIDAHPEIKHDDQLVPCPCCSCHSSHSKKEKRQKLRNNDTAVENAMGNIGEMSAKTRRGHQPQFLKTISIIDTLSELGADVNNPAEEKRISPRLGVRVMKSRKLPVQNGNNSFLAGKGPVVCPDLQQYSEKIYDAMTRKGGTMEQIKYHQSPYYNDGKKIPFKFNPKENGLRVENGLSLRVEENTPSEKLLNGVRERGRTPDWIRKIFEIAKKGNLELLKQNICGMEDTLVRNLSDHCGNNLLHVMAVYGHLTVIAWLLTSKKILRDGLQDENKYGLTPFVCAIKYGRLELVQWLVENTSIEDKIRCKEGERSLLHVAAKYCQEEIITWIVEYMMIHECPLDNKDHKGNTALHLASRSGNSRICSILLQHGADVTLKNDIGQTAWEICVMRGHLACAEYLCVHEAGLSLASDLTRREAELEAATSDNNDIRMNFKEMMAISRRLLRERDDAVRELSKFHETMIEAHDEIILATQVITDENSSLKERLNGVRHPNIQSENIDDVIGQVTALHGKWQEAQKFWYGSSLVNIKHRMLLVEEAWKNLRHNSHRTVASTHHPLDIFRSRLCGIRSQGNRNRLADIPSLYSSEESLGSLLPFSDDEFVARDEPSTSTPAAKSTKEVKSFKATITNTLSSNVGFNDNIRRQLNDVSQTSEDKCDYVTRNSKLLWNDTSLGKNVSLLSDLEPGERLAKDEINAKLKEFALTSESGSCSVLEVIEPSSEESDVHAEEDRRMSEMSKSVINCASADFRTKLPYDRKAKKIRHKSEDCRVKEGNAVNSCESGNDDASSISHIEKPFLVNEASTVAAAVNVSGFVQRPYAAVDEDAVAITGNANKRKGFLHKFIKPPLWNGKNKLKNNRKLDAVSLKEENAYSQQHFRKTSEPSVEYDHCQISDCNTPSSQDCFNSFEEASSGKLGRQTDLISQSKDHEVNSLLELTDSESTYENKKSIKKLISLSNNCHSISITPPPVQARRSPLEKNSPHIDVFDVHGENTPLNSLESGQKTTVSEVRSVATSEDSGIVARPASSASKSESVSRPESSSSTFPPYKTEFSLRKSNLSLTHEMLATPDLSPGGRMSPAPSEVSKTESALSPPSHASDLSKSESARQSSKSGLTYQNDRENGKEPAGYALTILPMKKDLDVKTAAIIEISCEEKKIISASPILSKESNSGKSKKAWYELSDEESDILLPDEFNSKVLTRNSSSEDERELC